MRIPVGRLRALLLMATGSALAASAYWALAATGHEETRGSGPGGSFSQERDLTLIESEGGWVIVLLVIPVVVAAVPLVLGSRKLVVAVCAGVLLTFALLGSFSIGLLYLPAALLLLSAALTASEDQSDEARSGPAPHLNENPLA